MHADGRNAAPQLRSLRCLLQEKGIVMKCTTWLLTIVLLLGFQLPAYPARTCMSVYVNDPPAVDGDGQDAAWGRAPTLITRDRVAGVDIRIQSVYTDKHIFFLIRFPDPDESRLHKPWVWDPAAQMYAIGPDREDCFVLKWALDEDTADLRLDADQPYRADIWFWKANRTDPGGYADDKIQLYSDVSLHKSKPIPSATGQTMFLQRKGDGGKPAYASILPVEYEGDTRMQYHPQEPSGSRADIRARGKWTTQSWCIEFSRRLVTGQVDDVQFDSRKNYYFGVSRYEIAGREPNAALSQPLYGSGDVSEGLLLGFGR